MRSPKGDKLAGCNTQVAVLTRCSLIFIDKKHDCYTKIRFRTRILKSTSAARTKNTVYLRC